MKIWPGAAQSIVANALPRGWHVSHTESMNGGHSGRCWFEPKKITCPVINDDYTLMVFLHEVAHARLHSRGPTRANHIQEFEADRWAMAEMRKLGIRVSRRTLVVSKALLYDVILEDRALGEKIHYPAWRWCNPQEPMKRSLRRRRLQSLHRRRPA